MNRVGVGLSMATDPDVAVAEAFKIIAEQIQLSQLDWVLVFFTTEHLIHAGYLHEQIRNQTNCQNIAGCSASGVLSGYEEICNGPGLVIMTGSTPDLNPLAFAKYQELEHSAGVNQQLRETFQSYNHPSSLLFFFPDIYQHQPHNFINMFNYLENGPAVFGGGACDDGSQQASVEFGPDIATLNGVSGLALAGNFEFQAGVTQSCATLGEPMFVTKTRDDLILTLDGVPALEVFTEVSRELDFADLETAAQHILFSFPLDPENPDFTGEKAIAHHVTGVDVESQGLTTSHMTFEGSVTSLSYRSPITAEQDLREMLKRLREGNANKPTFGVYFNCATRGETLYDRPNVDTQIIREVLGEFPLIGFFGGYEMAQMPQGIQLYTHTGVLVLMYL